MRVAVRCCGLGVPQQGADYREPKARRGELCGVGVAKVMDADILDACELSNGFPSTPYVLLMRTRLLSRKYIWGVASACTYVAEQFDCSAA